MAIPAYVPNNSAHVRLLGKISGSSEFGVGFWSPCTSVDVDQLSAFAEAVANAWAATILSDQWADASLESVRVLSYVGGHEYSGEYVAHLGGAAAGDGMPAQVAAVVNWFEALTYRGGHPRTYVWGLTYDQVNSDFQSVEPAYQSALQSNAAAFLAAFNAIVIVGSATATLSCLHRVEAGVPLAPGFLSALSSPSVATKLGTQRRRIGR